MNIGSGKASNIAANQQHSILAAVVRAVIYALAFALVLTFLVYLGLLLGWIHLSFLKPIFMYGNYFAILFGAGFAGYWVRGRGWLIGLVFGIAYSLLAAFIAPIWGIQGLIGSVFFVKSGIALGIGVLGGMVGVNI